MPARTKVAVSLSRDVLLLLDRNARGRSRSRTVEEELLRALRAREWDRLASQTSASEAAEATDWARRSLAFVDDSIRHEEAWTRRPRSKRRAPR